MRQGKPPPKTCKSLEKRWRSPQRDHWVDDAPPARLGAPDLDDAWKVECAWGSLPKPEQIILRSRYCLNKPESRIRYIVHRQTHILIGRDDFIVWLERSHMAMSEALERGEHRNRNILRAVVQKTLALVGIPVYKTR